MLFIDIKDFKCKECGCKEYEAISLNPVIVVCSKCGNIISDKDFKIEIQEVEE